ncbi:MAG TPA: DUF4126 domain-containing protein [Vicinamibacterales bacterium]|nr:DUF4126 domain-containing protein [Vicinamibacterales bacterium]
MPTTVDALTSLGLGLGLAAACGFRVFVPLLVLSVGAHAGYVPLADGWQWMGSAPAMIAFACATVFEVLGYCIPWVDHLLDLVATPAAVAAGMVTSASIGGRVGLASIWASHCGGEPIWTSALLPVARS